MSKSTMTLQDKVRELVKLYDEWSEHEEYHIDENCDRTNGHLTFDDEKFTQSIITTIVKHLRDGRPKDKQEKLFFPTGNAGEQKVEIVEKNQGYNQALKDVDAQYNKLIGGKDG